MKKQKAFDILEYVVVSMLIIFSIFEIVKFSLDIDKLIAENKPIALNILGISCFSVILVLSLILLLLNIKHAIYRNKFKKNY